MLNDLLLNEEAQNLQQTKQKNCCNRLPDQKVLSQNDL